MRNKALHRLACGLSELEGFVDNPEKFGVWVLLNKMKNSESKIPTNINLLDFKIKMEAEIRKTARKIERKIGSGLPDGMK